MTTLALVAAQAAGYSIGIVLPGPVGIALAGLAASTIDSLFLSTLFSQKDEAHGPRLNDLQIQDNREGAPANRLFGRTCRVEGTSIWQAPLREKVNPNASDKGGSGGEYITYRYFTHIAVEICRLKRGKTIKGISQVFADGKPFYFGVEALTNTSNQITADHVVVSSHTDFNAPLDVRYKQALKLISNEAAGGPDLSKYQSGRDVVLSGFSSTHPLVGLLQVGVAASTGATQIAIKAASAFGIGKMSQNDTFLITGGGGPYKILSPSNTDLHGSVLTGTINVGLAAGAGAVAVVLATGAGEAVSIKEGDVVSFSNQPTVEYTAQADLAFGASTTGTLFIDPPLETPLTTSQTISVSRFVNIDPPLATNVSVGANVTITSAATANNGTFQVWSSGRESSTKSYLRLRHRSNLFYEFAGKSPANDSITIEQEEPSFSKSQAGAVRFYHGSRTQAPDPIIVEVEEPNLGAGAVPAYRGRAYMVVEDLELTDFGNRVPNFEFVVNVEEDDSLAYALSEMLQDTGMSPSEFDLSGIPSTLKLGGFRIRGPQALKSAIQPLAIAYHLLSQQDAGKLKIIRRQDTSVLDVTGKTVAFAEGTERAPRPANFRGQGNTSATQFAVLKYIDPDNNYQTGKKQATGAVQVSEQLSEIDTGLTMTGDEAQKLIDTLFELHNLSTMEQVEVTLPPSYIGRVRESSRLALSAFGQDRQYLVTRIEEGANSLLRAEAVEEDLEAFEQPVSAGEGSQALTVATGASRFARANAAAPMILGHFMDFLLRDEHIDVGGFYLAATVEDNSKPWTGFSLYASAIESSGYKLIETFTSRATIGRVVKPPLDDTMVDHRFTDYASTIRVTLLNPSDELESVPEDEMLRGRNRFAVGGEVIGVANWSLISSDFEGRKTYQGSTLLRGISDTFEQMKHTSADIFVWLDGPGIYFHPQAISRIGEESFYKLVAGGGILTDAVPYSFAPQGVTVKPFRPVSISAERVGTDIVYTWERQSRHSLQLLDQGNPIEDEEEGYKVKVLTSTTDDTVVREVTVSTRTWTYTTADQITDGKTPGAAHPIEICLTSALVLEGVAAVVEL